MHIETFKAKKINARRVALIFLSCTLSQHLHKLGVAHGDLQGSNLMVEGSGSALNIRLIDYDTLIVPSSYGRKADAIALPSYQHPKRGKARRLALPVVPPLHAPAGRAGTGAPPILAQETHLRHGAARLLIRAGEYGVNSGGCSAVAYSLSVEAG